MAETDLRARNPGRNCPVLCLRFRGLVIAALDSETGDERALIGPGDRQVGIDQSFAGQADGLAGPVKGTRLESAPGAGYRPTMPKRAPFRYFKTSPEVIRLAVMLYVRFPLSLRNVEDLLHERGVDVSHETVRFWWHRFGPLFASEIRKQRVSGTRSSCWKWHVDEVFVKINGERHYLLRAVDHEGKVFETFVTKARDKKAALKFLRKMLKRHGRVDAIVTDRLRSYGAALRALGASDRQETGRWRNNRAENSHLPFRRRERAMLRFRRMRTLQRFVAVQAAIGNHFNPQRSLSTRPDYKANRTAAIAEWRGLLAA